MTRAVGFSANLRPNESLHLLFDALYLDGTISGIYAPALGRQDEGRGPFAGILGVTRRATGK